MAEDQPIILDIAQGVATITFNRPRAKNSLNVEALSALFTALGTCEDRADVGAVVLTGAGDAFCAGVNLKGYNLDDREELRAGFREVAMWWHQMLHRIVRLPKPVLAAVNGIAVGGGLGMVLASDMAVCNEDAKFFASWMANGVANDGGSSYTLAKVVGFRRAMELMLTNRTLDAREAVEWGICNRMYPNDGLRRERQGDRPAARRWPDPPAGLCEGDLPRRLAALARGMHRIRVPEHPQVARQPLRGASGSAPSSAASAPIR